jgi:DTW domain-containing protein
MCAELAPIVTQTRIVVIRHIRESWKSTGTARIAQLAMPHLTLLEYGDDGEPARTQLMPYLQPESALLFPSETAPRAEAQRVKTLLVLDGTWRQTRRMFQRLEVLKSVPVLPLPAKTSAVLRLRETHFTEGRSTLEAIGDALESIEGTEVAASVQALHDAYVERVFRARGVFDAKAKRLEER